MAEYQKLQKIRIGKAEKWLIDRTKEAGLDIEGFEHEITDGFIEHILKRHGDEKSENCKGQIAVAQIDFARIPIVITSPDFIITGAKRGKKNIIVYAKKIGAEGIILYFEEIIMGEKNKALRSMSMFKRTGDLDEQKFQNIVAGNGRTDISGAKITAEPGRQPGKLPI